MLSTDLSTVAVICAVACAAVSVILSVLCWVNARSARLYAANCGVWVEKVGKMRDPTAKVAELSAELTELSDSYAALLRSHKKLRARIGMRANREKKLANGGTGELSSMTDKDALRLAARSSGLLK